MNPLSRPFENILITTVDDGPFFIDELFQKKFAQPAPDHGIPLICFYRSKWDHFLPVCYANLLPYEEVILVGGVMTDGRAFQHMPATLSKEIGDAGGIYHHVIKFAFEHFKDDCEAFFGLVEDERSMVVNLEAGFEPTRHEHLIAHFHKPLSTERKNFLIEKIHGIGPF
jgi:hypothetical protein